MYSLLIRQRYEHKLTYYENNNTSNDRKIKILVNLLDSLLNNLIQYDDLNSTTFLGG